MTHSDEARLAVDAAALGRRLTDAFRDDLEIGDVLGVGAFAAVFRAHDPVLERDVALKVVDTAMLRHADNQAQFLAEARVVATVEHPHIVPLYSAEVREGLICLTMRLVPGRSLADRIAQGPLPPADAARIAREVAEALAAAHARGVVHRDVKPENVLLDGDGHAIVTDFGIALVAGRTNRRVPGLAIGTPQYLSPEQALGEAIDGRADVYSLGVVLYEMLTGRLPFEGPTTAGLLAKQILEAPPPMSDLRPDLPAALVAVTGRALTKAASGRPTAAQLAAELTEASTRQALLPPSVIRRRKRWRRIRWAAGIGVGLVAVLWIAGKAAYQGMTTYTGGVLPSLSASGANVPPGLVAEARADGSLEEGEVVEYAFVPAGRTWAEALLITDRAILRRTPGRPARRRAWDGPDLRLTFYHASRDRGLIVSTGRLGPPDTLYRGLSGAELGALSSAVATADAKHARRD